MPRDLRTCLHDVMIAIGRIQELTSQETLETYKANWVMRAAVERQFEIVGEALRRSVQIDESVCEQISDASKIIAFRNQVIHGYDVIDNDTVWGIIERFVPTLLDDVTNLLQVLGG